jgi:hypothetical protein
MIDPFLLQMTSWAELSRGKIRGDVVHEKLLAPGFTGCERVHHGPCRAACPDCVLQCGDGQ